MARKVAELDDNITIFLVGDGGDGGEGVEALEPGGVECAARVSIGGRAGLLAMIILLAESLPSYITSPSSASMMHPLSCAYQTASLG